VEIIADSVQFLGGRPEGDGGERQFVPAGAADAADRGDFPPSAADDDIPF
jgi:single-stranded DNA-binding protein